jgi:hypothetical protein
MLTEESLHEAVLKYGYFASEQEFSGWQDLIDFLNRQAVDFRRAMGREIPESIAGEDILSAAPSQVLISFLDRVERELIPHRLFDHAENFLMALLASGIPKRYPELCSRAARLLQRNKDARARAEIGIGGLKVRDARFVSLERHNELEKSALLAQTIRGRGCVFAPCS